jgi:uncharacterized protein (DUF433 family)
MMQIEDYFEFEDDAIRIKGHRIWIEHILDYYLSGYGPEEIAREFPGLSLDKVYAAITYYLTHRAEVDAYLIRTREQDERDYEEWAKHPSPLTERLRAIRAQRIERAMQAPPLGHGA